MIKTRDMSGRYCDACIEMADTYVTINIDGGKDKSAKSLFLCKACRKDLSTKIQ